MALRASKRQSVASTAEAPTLTEVSMLDLPAQGAVSDEAIVDSYAQWKGHVTCPTCKALGVVHMYNYKKGKLFRCNGSGGKPCTYKYDMPYLKNLVPTLDLSVPPPQSDLPCASAFLDAPRTPPSEMTALLAQVQTLSAAADPAGASSALLQVLASFMQMMMKREEEHARQIQELTRLLTAQQPRLPNLAARPVQQSTVANPVTASPTTSNGSHWGPNQPPTYAEKAKFTYGRPQPGFLKRYKPEDHARIEAALRRANASVRTPAKTRAEKEYQVRSIVTRLPTRDPRVVKNILYDLRFRMRKVLQVSYIGKDQWEVLVEDDYADACIAHLREAGRPADAEYDATKPKDATISAENLAVLSAAVQKRIALTIANTKVAKVKDFYTRLAAEKGWTTQVEDLVTAAKPRQQPASTSATAEPAPEQMANGSQPLATQDASPAAQLAPADAEMQAPRAASPLADMVEPLSGRWSDEEMNDAPAQESVNQS